MISHNKLCNLEDFADPLLATYMRHAVRDNAAPQSDKFPAGAEHRKFWEIAMAIHTLHGNMKGWSRDQQVLGVGAGTESTLFFLTRYVGRVFATDLYLDAGVWNSPASPTMLKEPEKLAPYEFDRQRLVVQRMDGRDLRYPAESFDGIFSSGSIEHFGSFDDVGRSAREMGRVLKRGGILSLSTEFRLSGGGHGWDGVLLFDPETIQRYIVEPSELEMVDGLDISISEATLATVQSLEAAIADGHKKRPHIVLSHLAYTFTSVHLALRKP